MANRTVAGKNNKDRKKKFVSIRLTEEEYSRLEEQFRNSGYTNRSKYLRRKILQDKFLVRRPKEFSEAEMRRAINGLSDRISCFGKGFNSLVSLFSEHLDASRGGASDVMDPESVDYYMGKLTDLSDDIRKDMDSIINIFLDMKGREAGDDFSWVEDLL